MSRAVVIGVCGSVGGAGKTTIAVNLATSLVLQQAGQVLLIDASLAGPGDAALLAGVETPRALSSFAAILPRLTPELFLSYIVPSSGGLSFISLTADGSRDVPIDLEGLQTFMRLASALYDFILLDFSTGAAAELRFLSDACHRALVVTTTSATALGRTRAYIADLKARQLPGSSISLCVNRVTSTEVVSLPQLEEELLVKCSVVLPDDVPAMAAVTGRGQPLVQALPRHAIARAIDAVARTMVGAGRAAHQPDSVRLPDAVGLRELKLRVHRRLVTEVELRKSDLSYLADPVKQQELRTRVEATLAALLDQEAGDIVDRDGRRRLLQELIDEALGLGPLEELLADPAISEVMVNRYDRVYVERNGRLERTAVAFASAEQLRGVIERIVSPLGRRIDERVPTVDARLRDGSRVNAVIPPVAIDGPVVTIRKFGRRLLGMPDLIELGSLSPQMAAFLDAAVRARINILVSGGTGSGKTTLLNLLSSFIPESERIITIEDAAELRLAQEHVVALETRPANIEGEGAITIRDLVRNALRMRPDRIIVGECRGEEALDMLQAMNTGHDGSLTTVHANSARDALARVETLALMSGMDLPSRAIREQIVSAIQLIVHQSRLKDGSRRITCITEVLGLDSGEFRLNDLFLFKKSGGFAPTGIRPSFFEALQCDGIRLPREVFFLQTVAP